MTDITIPAALGGSDAPAAPAEPPSPRPVLRTLVTAVPEVENLDPAAPDPDLIPGEQVLSPEDAAAGTLTEILHGQKVAEPVQRPVEDYIGSHMVFRLSVVLPLGDSRIPSMDLLMTRARAVLDGELLTPPEQIEGHFGPTPIGRKASAIKSAQEMAAARRNMGRGASGRPALRRRGIIETESGDSFGFETMLDLARQLGCAYTNVCTKYRAACAKAGVDPDDHDGVTFMYKHDKITVSTR